MTNLLGKLLYAVGMMALAGCSLSSGQMPHELNRAERPLVLVAVNDEGVIIRAGDGQLYSYSESYYFAQTILKSGLTAGDTLARRKP